MNPSSISSAAELLRVAQGARAQALPEKGEKFCEPPPAADSWLETQRLRARSEEVLALISEPAAAKRGDLWTGAWDPVSDTVELNCTPGKFWEYMGFQCRRRKFLHWEEAIMLCEMGVLYVTAEGVQQRCSVQEVQARLLQGSAARQRQYRLYAHLTRLGYRPVRHRAPAADTTEYERKIRLDQYLHQRKRKREDSAASEPPSLSQCRDSCGRTSDSCDSPPEEEAAASSRGEVDVDVEDGGGRPSAMERVLEDGSHDGCVTPNNSSAATGPGSMCVSVFHEARSSPVSSSLQLAAETPQNAVSTEPGLASSRPVGAEAGVQEKDTMSEDIETPLKRLDFTEEKRLFPNFFGYSGRVTVVSPAADLLPPNVSPRSQYLLDMAAMRRGVRERSRGRDSPRDRYPSALPVLTRPVRNWTEFKAQAALQSTQRPESPGSAALVPAGWSGSTSQLLSLLTLSPPPPPPPEHAAPPPPPIYDVYGPKDAFKKSCPPPPEFRVFVVRPEDQWADLSCPVGDGAPLRAAIVPAVGPPALYTVQQGSLTLEASVLTFPV